MLRSLVEPAFAKNPPIKVNVTTTVLGGVVCVLGSLAVLVAFLSLIRATLIVTGAGTWLVAVVLLLRAAGAGLAAYGGYRMYQYESEWRSRVIYGLALYALTEVLLVFAGASDLLAFLGTPVVYYLVVLSRVPPEPVKEPTPTA